MGKGYYIKKDNKDGLTLNIKKEQFVQYLQALEGDWLRFKIYERDVIATNGLTFNMELIERKNEGMNSRDAAKKPNINHLVNPTNKVDN